MKALLCTLLVLPAISMSDPKCQVGSALSADRRAVAAAIGAEWLKHALYCDYGTYQIMLSTDPKSDAIVLFRGNRPFVSYEHGFGITLIQDYPSKKAVPYLSVQDRDHSGLFRRLDYSLVDSDGNVVANAQDKNMSGQLTVTKYKATQAKTN